MPAALNTNTARTLPWQPNTIPLMLAPMQGLTNRELRELYIDWVRPDVVFSEFIRIAGGKRQTLRKATLNDLILHSNGVPLVAQLIGRQPELLAAAARTLGEVGIEHINLNLGCPFGRTTSSAIGGELLNHPEQVAPLLCALRDAVTGSFSVKLRAGYERPQQLLELLPILAEAGVDFLVLHPRTVVQQFKGCADHTITAAAVKCSPLPIIANGDITTAVEGRQVLTDTGAAGLMLGRGALADPFLFERLRQQAPALPSPKELRDNAIRLFSNLLPRYSKRYCGQAQVLAKIRNLLPYLQATQCEALIAPLQRAKTLDTFATALSRLEKS